MSHASLFPVSGLGAKAPACFLVVVGRARILLDLGTGAEPEQRPDLSALDRLDAVIFSHAHPDHIGAHAMLVGREVDAIWATERTWEVLGRELEHPADRYTLPARGAVRVAGITVTTGRTGHAPGGVWLHLAVGDGLLYLADVEPETAFYAYDPPKEAGTVILDASYGDWDTAPARARIDVLDAVTKGCLLPAPPLGRGPELALALHEAGYAPAMDAATATAVDRLLDAAKTPAPLLPGRDQALAELRKTASVFNHAAIPDGQGPIVLEDATAGWGIIQQMIAAKSTRDVLFTGYVPATGDAQALIATGGARFLRWPVHPRLTAQRHLVQGSGARHVLPAFTHRPKPAAWPGCTWQITGDEVAL